MTYLTWCHVQAKFTRRGIGLVAPKILEPARCHAPRGQWGLGLNLLARARDAGVQADGDKLRIRGPKRPERLAQALRGSWRHGVEQGLDEALRHRGDWLVGVLAAERFECGLARGLRLGSEIAE
jgi:hypothetical protein